MIENSVKWSTGPGGMFGIILSKGSANERWHYNVMSSLIGGTLAQNDFWIQYGLDFSMGIYFFHLKAIISSSNYVIIINFPMLRIGKKL